MAIFYDSVAKPDRDVLKLPIRGYVQANSASRQQWRKWIDAAELEWAKAHGGILYNKWFVLDCQETYTGNPKGLLLRQGQNQNFRVKGTAWTFSGTICVDLAGDESCYLVEITGVKFMEAQGGHQRSNTCPLRYVAAGPQFRLWGGNEGSRAQLSPNCHNILEFHSGVLCWATFAAMRS